MNTTNENGDTKAGIRSLRELSHDVPPPRDLWPDISAEIARTARSTTDAAGKPRSRGMPSRMQWLALAAMVASLAVGMWLGRTIFPVGGTQAPPQVASNGPQELVAAAYVTDPRYVRQRDELVRTLEARMKSLPPETRTKVITSLASIRKSITDIQAALGRDPGNALLQELLVNSYQDEMRVLTAVHEAGDPGREI
jgi:hypothetical protein